MKKKALIVAVIVTLILLADQLVKIYVKTNFEPGESYNLVGTWLVAEYIENQGMAFGTSFGSQAWHKLALSLFRVVAISALVYYWFKQMKKGAPLEFLIAIGLVFAGATGNLIDSMFYDFAFPYDPCSSFNYLEGSGNFVDCDFMGEMETKNRGFLFGNVVDMFKFHGYWPEWMPWIGGGPLFPAIWNIADASITSGVILIFIRQKKYFPKEEEEKNEVENSNEKLENEE